MIEFAKKQYITLCIYV